ncbi:hypothetical protein Bca4012_049298 [Brassica carinata]
MTSTLELFNYLNQSYKPTVTHLRSLKVIKVCDDLIKELIFGGEEETSVEVAKLSYLGKEVVVVIISRLRPHHNNSSLAKPDLMKAHFHLVLRNRGRPRSQVN